MSPATIEEQRDLLGVTLGNYSRLCLRASTALLMAQASLGVGKFASQGKYRQALAGYIHEAASNLNAVSDFKLVLKEWEAYDVRVQEELRTALTRKQE